MKFSKKQKEFLDKLQPKDVELMLPKFKMVKIKQKIDDLIPKIEKNIKNFEKLNENERQELKNNLIEFAELQYILVEMKANIEKEEGKFKNENK